MVTHASFASLWRCNNAWQGSQSRQPCLLVANLSQGKYWFHRIFFFHIQHHNVQNSLGRPISRRSKQKCAVTQLANTFVVIATHCLSPHRLSAHCQLTFAAMAACLSNTERMVCISKEMSYLLRHKPPIGWLLWQECASSDVTRQIPTHFSTRRHDKRWLSSLASLNVAHETETFRARNQSCGLM